MIGRISIPKLGAKQAAWFLSFPGWRWLACCLVCWRFVCGGFSDSGLAAHAAVPAGPSQPLRIVYGGDANFPPYEYLDESGRPAGLNVELIRAVAQHNGWDLRITLLPWPQVKARLESGAIDVAAMYRSALREQICDFAIPHELIYHEMYVRTSSPPVAALNELAGKRVLVQKGTYVEDSLGQAGLGDGLIRLESEPEVLRQLALGTGEVAVVTQTVGRPFARRSRLFPNVSPTGPPVLQSEYAFVTRKKRRDLIEQLNEGVMALKASGAYEHIYSRWVRMDRAGAIARATILAMAGLVLVAAGVIAWNYSLRRLVGEQTQALRREIEEREKALIALAESEKALRQVQKMETLGRLAGGIAHDFNNILTVILNYSRFQRQALVESQLPTADVDEILAAAERATRLTRQLLAFSRETPIQTVRLDLCALVRNMEGMIRQLVGDCHRVELHLPSQPVIIEAESTQIEQVLLNLAANARDAMPQGGLLAIHVRTQRLQTEPPWLLPTGNYAILTATDTGVGMDKEVMARIFDPFFTTKAVGKGTGLGLSTVFAVAAKLGGKVSVESELGRGSTFTVVLPSFDSLQAPGAAPAEVKTVLAGNGSPVLLVEDDDALRRAASIALERAGYHVTEAKDGQAAAELDVRGSPYAILVTDVVMPRMGGQQLAAIMRQRQPGLKVLFMSGYVQQDSPLDLSQAGTAFIAKPFEVEMLLQAVQQLLNLAEATHPPSRLSQGLGVKTPAAGFRQNLG